MFTPRRAAIAVAVALVLPAAVAQADGPAHPAQLELGDSWTFGDGASDPVTTGFAGRVFVSNTTELDCTPAVAEQAKDGCKHLQRVIHARPGTADNPGVTTDSLIAEQLNQATTLLSTRNANANPHDDVEVVLLSVGGNDVSRPVLAACSSGLTAGCIGVIKERLAHVETNLNDILADLRETAGDEATIVVLTYDNALAYCPLGPSAGALGAMVLEGYPPLDIVGLNNVIRNAAAANGVEVADTYGRLGGGQWVGDCLHPNDAGYATIAGIVTETIDS
jgi:lysophospholipase L1-like esterase